MILRPRNDLVNMTEPFEKVYAVSQKFNVSMRIAAYLVAINKVTQTYKYHGGY